MKPGLIIGLQATTQKKGVTDTVTPSSLNAGSMAVRADGQMLKGFDFSKAAS
jgi:hypothetical protein